jgi:hypothetical protein
MIFNESFHNWISKYPDLRVQYIDLKKNPTEPIDKTRITIYSDEWNTRQYQVKNYLLSKNNTLKKIYARKCIIRKIDREAASSFINNYHIQPLRKEAIKNAYSIGYNDTLLGIMTFGNHHRYSLQSNEIVLNRMCFINGFAVIGGASKLLSYFLKNNPDYDTVISWSDNRLSEGKVYEKMGFKNDTTYTSDYCYTKNGKKWNKQNFQKKKINCKKGQTEKERMEELNYIRIYDSGKTRWIYHSNFST